MKRQQPKTSVVVHEDRLTPDEDIGRGEIRAEFLEVEVSYSKGAYRGRRGYYLDVSWFGRGSRTYPGLHEGDAPYTIQTRSFAIGMSGTRRLLEEATRFNAGRLAAIAATWAEVVKQREDGRAGEDERVKLLAAMMTEALKLRAESKTRTKGVA